MKQRYRKILGLRFGCCMMKQRDMKELVLHTSWHNNALQKKIENKHELGTSALFPNFVRRKN